MSIGFIQECVGIYHGLVPWTVSCIEEDILGMHISHCLLTHMDNPDSRADSLAPSLKVDYISRLRGHTRNCIHRLNCDIIYIFMTNDAPTSCRLLLKPG